MPGRRRSMRDGGLLRNKASFLLGGIAGVEVLAKLALNFVVGALNGGLVTKEELHFRGMRSVDEQACHGLVGREARVLGDDFLDGGVEEGGFCATAALESPGFFSQAVDERAFGIIGRLVMTEESGAELVEGGPGPR
jgi:hypothetical protein